MNTRNADMRQAFAVVIASSFAVSAIAGRAGSRLQEKRIGVVVGPLAFSIGTREILFRISKLTIGHAVKSIVFGGFCMFFVCFSYSRLSEFVRVELCGIGIVGSLGEGAEDTKCSATFSLTDVGSTSIHRGTMQIENDTFQQRVGCV